MPVIERQIVTECIPKIGMIALIVADIEMRVCNASLFHAVGVKMLEKLCGVIAECLL